MTALVNHAIPAKVARPKGGVILVPYAGEWPEATIAAIVASPPHAYQLITERLPLTDNPRQAGSERYYEVLCHHWELCAEKGRDLVVIEHDVVIHKSTLWDFTDCTDLWCGNPLWMGNAHSANNLGCVRFRAALLAEWPDLVRKAGDRPCGGIEPRFWKRMDSRIIDELKERGYQVCKHRLGNPPSFGPCSHEPPVRHLHHYPKPDPEEWE